MPVWDWAVAAYARPGVAEASLRLQDEAGQNVSLLLWAWRARPNDAGVIAQAVACARGWDAAALQPLRTARRALKPPQPPVADAARAALREQIKAVELDAERVLLETLERLGGEGGAPSGRAALHAVAQAWARPAPDALLASLAAALE